MRMSNRKSNGNRLPAYFGEQFGRLWVLVSLLSVLSGCQTSEPLPAELPPTGMPTRVFQIGVDFATRLPPTAVVVELPTATPLPPPTVTPTPTPIIYEIIEGDTILGIAIAKNTTTENILSLNPGVRPELLQIGATLVLPPPATPIFGGAAATPLPVNLSVGQIEIYQTASGRSWLMGRLINDGDHWVTQAHLRIGIVDASGGLLGEQPAWTSGPLIPPGGAAPFGVLWPGELPDNARPLATVVQADGLRDPFDPALGHFAPLEVQNALLNQLETGTAVVGQIFNPAPDTAVVGEVVVTWLGRGGHIVGHATLRTPPIPPGSAIPFEIVSIPPGGRPLDFAVVATGITP